MEIVKVDLTKFLASRSGTSVKVIADLEVGGAIRWKLSEERQAWSARSAAWRHGKKAGKKFSFREAEGWLVLARIE